MSSICILVSSFNLLFCAVHEHRIFRNMEIFNIEMKYGNRYRNSENTEILGKKEAARTRAWILHQHQGLSEGIKREWGLSPQNNGPHPPDTETYFPLMWSWNGDNTAPLLPGQNFRVRALGLGGCPQQINCTSLPFFL